MTLAIGDKIPAAKLIEKHADGMDEVSTDEIFAGKKVVLIGLPGAFTPTCSMNHLPGFLENHDALKARGVDEIAVVATNDAHVMHAWGDSLKALGKIRFLADWDASFTTALGLDLDLSMAKLGLRSKRYSMIVDDGVVAQLNVEDEPGVGVSGAAATLEQL